MHLQAMSSSITWKALANAPVKSSAMKSTVISGNVYCGGGVTYSDGDEYSVYCYTLSHDKWTTLPPLLVKQFGLGKINGQLISVGGCQISGSKQIVWTNTVYTYDMWSRKWKETVPPMQIARGSPGVLSLQSALIVAGGDTSSGYSNAVEIFKPDTSQWYRSDPLPKACCDISLV